jgi:DNA replication protein DnaC
MLPEKKIALLEKEIFSKCKSCHGTGCVDCRAKLGRIKSYIISGIPLEYLFHSMKEFKGNQYFKEVIVDKIKMIESLYENGSSFGFCGPFGTGKTYAACCILKSAIVRGYSAKYITMPEVISELLNNSFESMKLFTSVDFLCIDEYDGRWIFPSEKSEQLFGQNLEFILRSRFQNKMPVILCSNAVEITKVLSSNFSGPISSLFAKHIEVFNVLGVDYRKV